MLKKMISVLKQKSSEKLTNSEKEFLPAVLEVLEIPPSPIGRTVVWTMVAIIIGGLLWSIFGHVDEVAVATGKIIPAGHVKIVQAEDKGVIKAIHVKDGQEVKQGQLLMELDSTITAADLERIKKEVAYYTLEIERLTAEKDNVPFNPVIKADSDVKNINFQMQLYQSRLNEFRAKVDRAGANIRQNEANIATGRVSLAKLRKRYEIAMEKEVRTQELMDSQAIPYFEILNYRSARLEIEQSLETQVSDMVKLEAAVAQSKEELAAVLAERDRDNTTKLVEDRKQLMDYTEELKKAQEKDRLSRIVSPIDGRVTQMAMFTVGGVVTAAQSLMVIVPNDTILEVEAWVANKDIGFIQFGQQAEIKVETFSFQKYGTIDATVAEISPDAVEDKEKGRVYRVVLNLAKEAMFVNNKEVSLNPGMSVNAEIKIRQKRIIEFFLDPFRKYQSEALRER